MKYVRTKERENGLAIIVKSEHYYHNELCYCGAEKSADTIEELCDEFVIEHLDGTKSIFENHDLFCQHRGDNYYSFYFNNLGKYDGSFYGAIWTDKGLIFVAKMNEKGELELL